MSGSSRRKIGWSVTVAFLLIVVGGGIWYYQQRERDRLENERALAQELVQLKNLGLGKLENSEAFEGQLPLATEAEAAFLKIAEARPDLVLGPRNLALARLITLAGGTSPDRIPTPGQPTATPIAEDKLTEARTAIKRLREVEPNSAVTSVLSARIEAVAGTFGDAREALAAAAAQAPDEPWVWYERYRLDRFAPEENLREDARDALGSAYQTTPQNLWLAREWLVVLAERRSPDIEDVLETTRETLLPLAEGIQQRTRVDVLELIDQALVALKAGDWSVVTRSIRGLVNVTVQEEQVQSDKLAVDRNALEFVAVDFPQEFYTSIGIDRRPAPDAIPVRFESVLFDNDEIKARSLSDLVLDDFNLDGSTDIGLLLDSRLKVVGLSKGATHDLMSFEVPSGFSHLIAADLDVDVDLEAATPTDRPCHDADSDVVLYGPGGILVLENRRESEQRRFIPAEQSEEFSAIENVVAAAFADFDLDGDLDLIVSAEAGMSLWANVGSLRFENRTSRSSLPEHSPTQILPVDLDRDVDLDLVLAGPDGPAGYLENLRHGNLRWRPFEPEIVGHSVELSDIDGNASWDLIIASDQGLTILSSQTPEPGRWTIVGSESVANAKVDRTWQFDYDNDGLPDLLTRSPDGRPVLWRNLGGRFEATQLIGKFQAELLDADFADFDGDGDLDLVLATVDGVQFLKNHGGNANDWLDVSLLAQQVKGGEASQSGRVNHRGLGSLLELKAGPIYQPAIVRGGTTHFGLGKQRAADLVRVVWTNGIPQNILQPKPKQFICEKQSLKGSCPYLYSFDGEKFVFSTDLLWAAPIGLQFAEGIIAPTRAWEYLKLTSPIVPDRNGDYLFQITEELWEAAYFDQVELIAVDHPPGVEVYTNEKVGLAEFAAPRLHTVSDPKPLVAARDGKGRDVTPLLADADDRYVNAFDEKYLQGLCESHAIELDFGDLETADRVTLFLTGWIYPSDTSINVALGQRDDLPRPKPPSLSVPNEQGEWIEVLPSMGFPGGKTKTIAVDLTDTFLSDDRRVRIETNLEIYWDCAFVTVDEPAVAVISQRCPLIAADLHYRGVSAAIAHPQHGPERYDYDDVSTGEAWPPMRGTFTRYGEVSELLRDADDCQVVMSSGDEMTLRFSSPGEPPAGWKRTFVLHNVGYDKDADLNTVYGQSSEPLPFQAMETYPYEPMQSFPDTAKHRRFLNEYQTRRQSRSFWTSIRGATH